NYQHGNPFLRESPLNVGQSCVVAVNALQDTWAESSTDCVAADSGTHHAERDGKGAQGCAEEVAGQDADGHRRDGNEEVCEQKQNDQHHDIGGSQGRYALEQVVDVRQCQHAGKLEDDECCGKNGGQQGAYF